MNVEVFLFVLAGIVFFWLLVMRLSDVQHSPIMRMLGPLGRRLQQGSERRSQRYRRQVATDARTAFDLMLPRLDTSTHPPGPKDVLIWVSELEAENSALRSFVVADPQRREDWATFVKSWREATGPLR